MEADVNRTIEEQLSAFLDGELPEEELQLLVRRLEKDEDYRATLARFSMIGNVLRNDPVYTYSDKFRSGIMASIDNDKRASVRSVESGSANSGWLRPAVAGIAVALVAVALLNVPFSSMAPQSAANMSAGAEPVGPAAVRPAAAGAPSAELPQSGRANVRAVPAKRAALDRERLTSYMVSHGEYARLLHGPMANSRIVIQQASFED